MATSSYTLPSRCGWSQTRLTVSEASRLVSRSSKDPDFIELARDIVVGAGVPERDHYGEIVAVHNWVKNNSRYTNDSADAEVLYGPKRNMAFFRKHGQIAGDCDDLVMFEATLLRAIGRETRAVTISRAMQDPVNSMQHIYFEAQANGDWISLDPILKRRPAGYSVPVYTAKRTLGLGGDDPPGTSWLKWLAAGAAVWWLWKQWR